MRTILLCYAISGLLSLGYQVVWLRHFVDRFGSNTLTFVLVICGFIGGLGAGALASRRITEAVKRRFGIPDLVLYGWIEITIAVTALLVFAEAFVPVTLASTFPYALRDGIHEPTLAYWLLRIPLAVVTVTLPCFFMGITYPLLCQFVAHVARFPSRLYAWNTLGACSGVLACEFFLIRYAGTDRTLVVLVAANVLLGLFFVARGARLRVDETAAAETVPLDAAPRSTGAWRSAGPTIGALAAGAIVSGFLSGAIEADVFRWMQFHQIFNDSSMAFVSFWAILAIFTGSWWVHRRPGWSLRHVKVAYVSGFLIYVGTVYYLLTKLAWWTHNEVITTYTAPSHSIFTLIAHGETGWQEEGSAVATTAGFAVIGLATFPAYFCISLLLPHLCNVAHGHRRHLGKIYGLNTLAFMLGMVSFTWLAPWVNMFYSFKLCTLVFLVLVVLTLFISETRPLRGLPVAGALVAVTVAALLVPTEFDHGLFPEGTSVQRSGARALRGSPGYTTFISEQSNGDALYLGTGRMSDTTVVAKRYMKLHAHIPLLSHPQPERVLLICFGVGNTAAAVAKHSTVERLDVVDLSRNILETSPEFAFHNDRIFEDPRVRFIHDDGRAYLQVTDEKYDLITSEPPPPLMQGISRLYSVEYYEDVLEHLTPGGFMTQWLPIYQVPPEGCTLIVDSFVQTFPHTLLFVGVGRELVLVGSKAPIDLRNLVRRFEEEERVRGDLCDIGIPTPIHLLASILWTGDQLREYFGEGGVVSDQHNALSLYWPTGRMVSFPYDPHAVLDRLPEELASPSFGLRGVVTNFQRLRNYVSSFPGDSLAYASTKGGPIRHADVDWVEVERQNRLATRALVAGDYETAWEHLDRSDKLVKGQSEVAQIRGLVRFNMGRHSEAAGWLDFAATLSPENASAHYLSARASFLARELDAAQRSLEKALAINPYDFEAQVLMGRLRAALGDRPGAIRHFETALALKPQNDEVLDLLDRARKS